MTTLDKIKEVYLTARRNRDSNAVASLSTLLGEIEKASLTPKGKVEVPDSEVIAKIKKSIDNIDFTLSQVPAENTTLSSALLQEKLLMRGFLPEQITGEALYNIIVSLSKASGITGPKLLGLLKKEQAGKYDAKEAADLVKTMI